MHSALKVPEILRKIFEYLFEANEYGPILWILEVPEWKESGLSVFLKHTYLVSNSSLQSYDDLYDLFINPKNAQHVQALTIDISNPEYWSLLPITNIDHSLNAHLCNLKSLSIECDDWGSYGTNVGSDYMDRIIPIFSHLRALVSLQLDVSSEARDRWHDSYCDDIFDENDPEGQLHPEPHLCPAFREILPQLKHFRFRGFHICKAALPRNSANQLEVLSIDLIGQDSWKTGTEACASTISKDIHNLHIQGLLPHVRQMIVRSMFIPEVRTTDRRNFFAFVIRDICTGNTTALPLRSAQIGTLSERPYKFVVRSMRSGPLAYYSKPGACVRHGQKHFDDVCNCFDHEYVDLLARDWNGVLNACDQTWSDVEPFFCQLPVDSRRSVIGNEFTTAHGNNWNRLQSIFNDYSAGAAFRNWLGWERKARRLLILPSVIENLEPVKEMIREELPNEDTSLGYWDFDFTHVENEDCGVHRLRGEDYIGASQDGTVDLQGWPLPPHLEDEEY